MMRSDVSFIFLLYSTMLVWNVRLEPDCQAGSDCREIWSCEPILAAVREVKDEPTGAAARENVVRQARSRICRDKAL